MENLICKKTGNNMADSVLVLLQFSKRRRYLMCFEVMNINRDEIQCNVFAVQKHLDYCKTLGLTWLPYMCGFWSRGERSLK